MFRFSQVVQSEKAILCWGMNESHRGYPPKLCHLRRGTTQKMTNQCMANSSLAASVHFAPSVSELHQCQLYHLSRVIFGAFCFFVFSKKHRWYVVHKWSRSSSYASQVSLPHSVSPMMLRRWVSGPASASASQMSQPYPSEGEQLTFSEPNTY